MECLGMCSQVGSRGDVVVRQVEVHLTANSHDRLNLWHGCDVILTANKKTEEAYERQFVLTARLEWRRVSGNSY